MFKSYLQKRIFFQEISQFSAFLASFADFTIYEPCQATSTAMVDLDVKKDEFRFNGLSMLLLHTCYIFAPCAMHTIPNTTNGENLH